MRLRYHLLDLAEWFGAHQVAQRDAHERDRARQRIVIAGVIALLVAGHAWVAGAPTALGMLLTSLCAGYGAYALFHLKVVLAREHAGLVAQYLLIVIDSAFTVIAIAGAPQVLATLYPVLMVQIVRCGMRYGMRTLWLSWGAAAVTALVSLPMSDFWRANLLLLQSFAVMLLLIPPLMAPLIKRLHQANAELRAAADADPLTGLGNRRGLHEQIVQAQARGMRDDTLLALVLIDLDNFKRVNDTLGHAQGDRLLQSVAACMRRASRDGDPVLRLGGDEFMLLVTGLPVDTGPARAQAIADAAAMQISMAAEGLAPGLGVTASAGVCCWSPYRDAGLGAAEWLALADAAMYEKKRSRQRRPELSAA